MVLLAQLFETEMKFSDMWVCDYKGGHRVESVLVCGERMMLMMIVIY